jgi:hypothetical protein
MRLELCCCLVMLSGLASPERMNESVPSDLPARVARASDAQKAAIERVLAGELFPDTRQKATASRPALMAAAMESSSSSVEVLASLGRIERKLDAVQKSQTEELKAELWKVAGAIKHAAAAQPPISQGEAQRIFSVLQRLRSKRAGMMAPLADVFVATVLEGRSQRAAAKSCGCSPALLSKRVGELETEFGLPLKQLQNYAQPLLEMETSVRGQRYARKGRGAPEDEAGQYDQEDSQAAAEDHNGYLPEERQDDG